MFGTATSHHSQLPTTRREGVYGGAFPPPFFFIIPKGTERKGRVIKSSLQVFEAEFEIQVMLEPPVFSHDISSHFMSEIVFIHPLSCI